MIVDRHWWRTNDGDLVPDGDPRAAFLAYPKGHEIPDHLAEKVGLAAAVRALADDAQDAERSDEDAYAKQAAKPADKMAARGEDKGSAAPRRARRTQQE